MQNLLKTKNNGSIFQIYDCSLRNPTNVSVVSNMFTDTEQRAFTQTGAFACTSVLPEFPVRPWTMGCALPSLRWMSSGRAGHAWRCVALKQQQLEENELRDVAWGARFCDNISALRDGMRCTESKLTIISCLSRLWPQRRARTRSLARREPGDPDFVRKTSRLTFVCVWANILTFSP